MVTGFQFLRLAQTLRHYGYLRFDACVADFPEKDCPVQLLSRPQPWSDLAAPDGAAIQPRYAFQFSSVTQSCLNLHPHGLQHARPPHPSLPTSFVHSDASDGPLEFAFQVVWL